jgi:hopanoid biosynthesis associated protein HpnK
MKQLIVSADDFGWSEAVNEGILRAYIDGIVTSTTLMANLPNAAAALARARREAPRLAVGLHLNLTVGTPLRGANRVRPIVDEQGNLRSSIGALFRNAFLNSDVRNAIAEELEAQAAWASDFGLKPSHLDSHKHVHQHPAILHEVIAVARRHGIGSIRTTLEVSVPSIGHLLPPDWGVHHRLAQWMRARLALLGGRLARRVIRRSGLLTTDWFFGIRATGAISPEMIKLMLQKAPRGAGELMVHVGLRGDTSKFPTRLSQSRPRELEAVTDSDVKGMIMDLGWQLITFKELKSERQT